MVQLWSGKTSQAHCSPRVGHVSAVGVTEQPHVAYLLGKVDGISNPAAARAGWSGRKVTTVGRHECVQAARPRKIRSPALQVKSSCPDCVQSRRGCCATHPRQTCKATPSYFLLHKSALGKHQHTARWCNYLSRHKVIDTVC